MVCLILTVGLCKRDGLDVDLAALPQRGRFAASARRLFSWVNECHVTSGQQLRVHSLRSSERRLSEDVAAVPTLGTALSCGYIVPVAEADGRAWELALLARKRHGPQQRQLPRCRSAVPATRTT